MKHRVQTQHEILRTRYTARWMENRFRVRPRQISAWSRVYISSCELPSIVNYYTILYYIDQLRKAFIAFRKRNNASLLHISDVWQLNEVRNFTQPMASIFAYERHTWWTDCMIEFQKQHNRKWYNHACLWRFGGKLII